MKKQQPRFVTIAFAILFFHLNVTAQRVSSVKVNASNALAYRDSLKLVVFGSTTFPYNLLPDSVHTNVNSIAFYQGFPYNNIYFPQGNLDSIDRISIYPSADRADFPQPVQAYLFHPHTSNGKLFIYHSGHCAGTTVAEDIAANGMGINPGLVIPSLLKRGYTVLAVPMLNYKLLQHIGYTCGYNNHNNLFSDGHYAFPLSLFFKPLIASLNYLGRNNFNAIYMCGLSGGGWTTSVYPALDPAVNVSFPIAGSWPLELSQMFNAAGDQEQYYPALFQNLLNYQDLYALACLAPARKMLQINNRFDACCFQGSTGHIFYADSVTRALRGSGGIYKFYLDETERGHQISQRAMDVVFAFLKNDTATLRSKPKDTVTSGTSYLYEITRNFYPVGGGDNSELTYSLLKAPSWISIDAMGRISGRAPDQSFFNSPDTISFKVEDSTGRFVVHNYQLVQKRASPYFFTSGGNDSVVYFIPEYRNSTTSVNQLIASSLGFNRAGISVQQISILNNSLLKLKLNTRITNADSIKYTGNASPYALTYNTGLKFSNFSLNPIHRNITMDKYAATGMIRFNTETKKFEYFNGTVWVDMH